ncbi:MULTISPECIES: iron-sulfur cluster repair di-iron protein [Flavobacterium]|jgi:regulator of cell morphogenesis and NO signaling|uniref:Regulator of cell morphogenesis and NO signaling n=3 Tax=Flavobacterium TaxID=237 RepID=A0A7W7IX24_9FLAO|nr:MULTISPECIES: iron-sulfur cluster repair di-iron protein [Flavobacterium]KRB55485.1 iron-sulfur cluster repair di-iron protein [Flavobacterium sp. Root186]MBB4802057.1 regulator of cell morphogenesis and NO signaling [Flavobacterium nitrogenifigens]MBB6387015.1 regulator of cell morphogenesis and NO signaling [Flavobacterium notoginsengisoli]MWB93050.1 iron-sulfur cluster repair di-iron protein [Flavobacterium hydrocarbonoxydans]
MKTTNKTTIGEIAADDFRTAAIFSKYSIDFCYKGHRTLKEACKKRGIEESLLIEELDRATNNSANQSFNYKSWSSDLLADYIEKTHHRYVAEKTPVLLKLLNELCTLHGETYPDLFEINTLFTESALDLSANMRKKEQILFPFIKKINEAHAKGLFLEIAHFGTLENQILLIKEEHDTVGQRFKKIAALTKNYTAPADTCNTYKVTFAMLKEFERDLHKHIHLENNILFPKSVALEKA